MSLCRAHHAVLARSVFELMSKVMFRPVPKIIVRNIPPDILWIKTSFYDALHVGVSTRMLVEAVL